MGVSRSLKQLTEITEQLEASGRDVELSSREGRALADDGLSIDLEVVVPLLAGVDLPSRAELAATDAALADDGTLSVGVTVSVAEQAGTPDGGTEPTDATANQVTDGGTAIDGDAPLPAADVDPVEDPPTSPQAESGTGGASGEPPVTQASDPPGSRTDPPAYSDPERLAAVYDSERTFAEMTEALGVDVTPQTVRRHMIEHGIHAPGERSDSASGEDRAESSGAGSADPSAGEPDGSPSPSPADADDRAPDEAARDGNAPADDASVEVDLPDHVGLDDVAAAVRGSKTLYEVQRDLRIGRSETRRVLDDLDLLDLVHGRVSTASDRSNSPDEIESRLRNATATE